MVWRSAPSPPGTMQHPCGQVVGRLPLYFAWESGWVPVLSFILFPSPTKGQVAFDLCKGRCWAGIGVPTQRVGVHRICAGRGHSGGEGHHSTRKSPISRCGCHGGRLLAQGARHTAMWVGPVVCVCVCVLKGNREENHRVWAPNSCFAHGCLVVVFPLSCSKP